MHLISVFKKIPHLKQVSINMTQVFNLLDVCLNKGQQKLKEHGPGFRTYHSH